MKSELDILNEIKLKKKAKAEIKFKKRMTKNKKINEKIHKKNIKRAFKLFKKMYTTYDGADSFYFYEGILKYREEENVDYYYSKLCEALHEKYPKLKFTITLFGTGIQWWEIKEDGK